MKMVTSPNGNNDKSLDTLMLEHEEKEIQSKIMAFGQSFISESEHMLDSDHLHTSYANEDQEIEESIVVKGNINSNSNLKNLRKQFACNQLVHITSRDEDSNRRMDIKTTAATTNRNHNLDEQTVNIKAGNKATTKPQVAQKLSSSPQTTNKPFEYKRSESFENINRNKNNLQEEINMIKLKHNNNQKEETKCTIGNRLSSDLNQSKYSNEQRNKIEVENTNKDINMIVQQSFRGTYMAVTDLFVGLLDYFNHEDSSDDEGGSIVRCFGCSKNSKKKHISHKDRRIRAISQARLSKEKYFNMEEIISKSKSKEFLSNNNLQMIRVKSLTRIQTDVDRNSNTATLNSGNVRNSDSKRTPNRPESSQEMKTNQSTKPHSKMISSDILDSNK